MLLTHSTTLTKYYIYVFMTLTRKSKYEIHKQVYNNFLSKKWKLPSGNFIFTLKKIPEKIRKRKFIQTWFLIH